VIDASETVTRSATPVDVKRSSLALRFAAGAAMGTLIVSVPFAAGHPLQFSSVEIVAAALVVSTSGVMGCLWGGRFLEAVSRALDSTAV
jgi:ribosome biogenesis protein Tsr3